MTFDRRRDVVLQGLGPLGHKHQNARLAVALAEGGPHDTLKGEPLRGVSGKNLFDRA